MRDKISFLSQAEKWEIQWFTAMMYKMDYRKKKPALFKFLFLESVHPKPTDLQDAIFPMEL